MTIHTHEYQNGKCRLCGKAQDDTDRLTTDAAAVIHRLDRLAMAHEQIAKTLTWLAGWMILTMTFVGASYVLKTIIEIIKLR